MLQRFLIAGFAAALLAGTAPAAFAKPDCPPGLDKKSPPCVAPGQVGKLPGPNGVKMPPIDPKVRREGEAKAKGQLKPLLGQKPPKPRNLARPEPTAAERAQIQARSKAQLKNGQATISQGLRIKGPDGRYRSQMALRRPIEAIPMTRILPGQVLNRDRAFLIERPAMMGLPPHGDAGWRYFLIDDVVVRADPQSLRVVKVEGMLEAGSETETGN